MGNLAFQRAVQRALVIVGLFAPPAFAAGWQPMPMPNASLAPTELTAVSCTAADDCWAIGKAGEGSTCRP